MQTDIRRAGDGALERIARHGRGAVVDQLDRQQAVGRVAEGAAKRGDGGQRIFARERRAHVEGREHDQRIVRQAETRAHIGRGRTGGSGCGTTWTGRSVAAATATRVSSLGTQTS